MEGSVSFPGGSFVTSETLPTAGLGSDLARAGKALQRELPVPCLPQDSPGHSTASRPRSQGKPYFLTQSHVQHFSILIFLAFYKNQTISLSALGKKVFGLYFNYFILWQNLIPPRGLAASKAGLSRDYPKCFFLALAGQGTEYINSSIISLIEWHAPL